MQISLKQREIENAIKAYVQAQGLNLTGKEVTIDFTAGRGQAGLTADVNIEEAGTAAAAGQTAPLGKVTTSDTKADKPASAPPAPATEAPAAAPAAESAGDETGSAPAAKTSLFGG